MSISRLGVVLKFGDSSLQRLNQRFDFPDSVARRDVFGTAPIKRNHVDEEDALDDALHVRRGKLRDKFGMLSRVLDPRVAEDFQPSALRLIHPEEAHVIVHGDVASRKHLAVGVVICERPRREADDSKKARLAAAMPQVRPAGFIHRRPVETVTRLDESDFIVRERVRFCAAGHTVGITVETLLRFAHRFAANVLVTLSSTFGDSTGLTPQHFV